jgi:2-polyprenyl-6-methoxyphenol hydroxylase-like FAD-dependent oxidoreductase
LIVGAGPTGLALAAQLRWFVVPFRIVDRAFDRARESRALAVQARTLEVLDSLGLAEPIVARGNTSARLILHVGAERVASTAFGDIRAKDTRFPFILFVSQAETERVLVEHLASSDVTVERRVDLVRLEPTEGFVSAVLRHPDGSEEHVRASYVVGCDGAHSFVRRAAGFEFEGGSYPEEFVLGDVEADGPLEPNAINAFVHGGGVALFFPLRSPATWRVIAMKPRGAARPDAAAENDLAPRALELEELGAIIAVPTEGSIVVRDPVWLTGFRLHHRQVARYRNGRVFLAGDAAHIHSPVGGQGMNTGIQDAWNLGWKLAFVLRGDAGDELLESYQAERWPVGRALLRYTDRAFSTFTRALSTDVVTSFLRTIVVSRVMPALYERPRFRQAAFAFVSELGIHYRKSPIVDEGRPKLPAGPRPGERLPDARLSRGGRPESLQRAVVSPGIALLLCGDVERWDRARVGELVSLHRLARVVFLSSSPSPGALHDADGSVSTSLGAAEGAQYLVRPDGYIAFRRAGYELGGVGEYLSKRFTKGSP